MKNIINIALNYANINIKRPTSIQYDYHCHVSMCLETPLGPQVSECDLTYSFTPGRVKRPVWDGVDPRFTLTGGPLMFNVSKGIHLIALTDFLPTPEKIFYPGSSMNDIFKPLSKIKASHCLAPHEYPIFVLLSKENGNLRMQKLDGHDLQNTLPGRLEIGFINVTLGERPHMAKKRQGQSILHAPWMRLAVGQNHSLMT